MCRLQGRSKLTSVFTLIVNNPHFHPGLFDAAFRQWGSSGISRLKDLFSDDMVMPFEQLIEKYGTTGRTSFVICR